MLHVDPARYRRGVGRLLLQHAVAHGGARVETAVLVGNDAALALYLGEGFTIAETRVGRLGGNEAFPASGRVIELLRPPMAGKAAVPRGPWAAGHPASASSRSCRGMRSLDARRPSRKQRR